MEEISLYRKYRPHNFDNLVGQDHVKTTLINGLKSGHVSHAYLFTGPRGTGKTSTARLLAKAINCANLKDGFEPCNECDICKDIADGRLIDLIEIDAASNRGIDEVRDLKEKINFAPTRSKVKVYIIDEVHMMTKEAFNALLKTLEEPPAHAYFILATTEVHKIPETIISRCQRFDFKRINHKTLMTRLSYIAQIEGITAEDDALEAISKYVDGGLRDAIGLLEQLTIDNKLTLVRTQEILGISGLSLLQKMYDVLVANQTKEALNIIDELHVQGSDLRQFLHEFIDLLRNKMLEAVMSDKPQMIVKSLKMIAVFQKAQQRLESEIPQLPLEIAVIEITNNFEGIEPEKSRIIEPIKATVVSVAKPAMVEKAVTTSAPVEIMAERIHQPIENIDKSADLNIDSIKKNWARVVERIKTPSLKNSLKNGLPIELDKLDLTLQFATNFHKDKIIESANRAELENTIKEIFGHTVRVLTVVKSIEIKPVINDEPMPAEEDNSMEDVLGIFGGEVVG